MTARNSTCENFLPGQMRGPPDQGMNVPGAGSMMDSDWRMALMGALVGLGDLIHRDGRHCRESGPQ